jgi:hypothetical protein
MGMFPSDELKNILLPILGAGYLMLRASNGPGTQISEKEVMTAIGSLDEAKEFLTSQAVRDIADGFKALAAGKLKYDPGAECPMAIQSCGFNWQFRGSQAVPPPGGFYSRKNRLRQ